MKTATGGSKRSGKNSAYPVTLHKDFRPLFDAAMEAGWSWRWTGKGHILLQAPQGGGVTFAASPSETKNATHRARSQLRRYGLVV